MPGCRGLTSAMSFPRLKVITTTQASDNKPQKHGSSLDVRTCIQAPPDAILATPRRTAFAASFSFRLALSARSNLAVATTIDPEQSALASSARRMTRRSFETNFRQKTRTSERCVQFEPRKWSLRHAVGTRKNERRDGAMVSRLKTSEVSERGRLEDR